MSQLFNVLADQQELVKEQAYKLFDSVDKIKQLKRQTVNELRFRKITQATYNYRMKQYDELEETIGSMRDSILTSKSLITLLRGVASYESQKLLS